MCSTVIFQLTASKIMNNEKAVVRNEMANKKWESEANK